MNTPEKIVNTYFRLNGFFLLPQFTLFFRDGGHTHVDFLGIRHPSGQEICEEKILPVDTNLFSLLSEILKTDSKDLLLGILAEVKGNDTVEIPPAEHIAYAQNFFGPNVRIAPISISTAHHALSIGEAGCLLIPLDYTLQWCLNRFRWMDQNLVHLKKSGSWNWSEETLSDLLYFQKIGFASLDSATLEQFQPKE